jgi:hypothetical protein
MDEERQRLARLKLKWRQFFSESKLTLVLGGICACSLGYPMWEPWVGVGLAVWNLVSRYQQIIDPGEP